jgi:hypothetical protein
VRAYASISAQWAARGAQNKTDRVAVCPLRAGNCALVLRELCAEPNTLN